jgi:hypothetical protein
MKKLTAFLLAAVLCLSLVTVRASAADQEKLNLSSSALTMMGALQGDGTGGLNLSGTLTRAQFCKIAVVVMGQADSVGSYSGYTIFPDVPSTSWASGYINLAVRSAGIMSGYANGKFGPDDIITYGQAVTVLMKMLGYTTADVGAKWPDGFIAKAAEIGLTDSVTLAAGASISRGDAAVLFVNLLDTELNGSAKKFMETISGATVIGGVFLISSSAKTDTGEKGAVEIGGVKNGAYLPVGKVPDALLGAYGSLVLDDAGNALVFVPARAGKTVVSTVSSVSSSIIKCTDWSKITPAASTTVYLNGTITTYGSAWVDISAGMRVSAYYSDGGTVQYIMVSSISSDDASIAVVTTDSYQLPADTTVYLNGKAASASDIIKYDVLSMDDGYKTCYATRKTITGRIEALEGSAELPSAVTMFGITFPVLDSAAASFAEFSAGSTIALLLTSDNKVAAAFPVYKYSPVNYGIVQSLTAASATVTLLNGLTVSGKVSNLYSNVGKGSLVSVNAPDSGVLSMSVVADIPNGQALDLKTGKLGDHGMSPATRIFDSVGGCGVTEIALSDIAGETIDASKIKCALLDSSGKLSLLLLNDATGDAYTYGFIKTTSVTTGSGSMTATTPAVTVTNSGGTTDTAIGSPGFITGDVAGIAIKGDGYLEGAVRLTAVDGIKRDSFQTLTDDRTYITLESGLMMVSGDVQVYLESTGKWMTLDQARGYSDSFTAYYDRTPSTGAKVRVLIAH